MGLVSNVIVVNPELALVVGEVQHVFVVVDGQAGGLGQVGGHQGSLHRARHGRPHQLARFAEPAPIRVEQVALARMNHNGSGLIRQSYVNHLCRR